MRDPDQFAWLEDVPVEVEAAIAGPTLRVGQILALEEGSVISTSLPAGETVEIFAAGAPIGGGELSNSGSRTSVRMVYLGSRS
jgi:flagellar motor switch/type III secretory pathway protein FliN